MPKQEFAADSVIGSFPVPQFPAFFKNDLYQVRWKGQIKRKKGKKQHHTTGKNEKHVNILGNAQMFERMLLIHSK